MGVPSRSTAVVTAFAFLFASVPMSVAEEDAPTLAILGFRSEDSHLERQIRSYLASELGGTRRVLVASDEVSGRIAAGMFAGEGKEVSASLEEAKARYLEGKQLYENLSIDEAIGELNKAVTGFREGISGLRDNRLLLASHLWLGMALAIKGRAPEAKDFIRQMVVLDPGRRARPLSKTEFPPKIVNLHNEVTKEVLAGPMGSISLKSQPQGAVVFFDGVEQRTTPLRIDSVPAGDHFLLMEHRGYRQHSQPLRIKAGTNEISVDLVEWSPVAPYGFDRRRDVGVNDLLSRSGTESGASLLLLGQMSSSGKDNVALSVQLYDVRSKEFSKIIRIDSKPGKIKRAASELSRAIVENLTMDGLVVAQLTPEISPKVTEPQLSPKPPREAPPEVDSGPVWKRWWFWTLVAGAAAGGGYFGFQALRTDPNSTVLVIDNPLN